MGSAKQSLLILVMCLAWTTAKLNNYCSLCDNHTMCKYQGVGSQCKDAGGSGVSAEEKKEILKVHNQYRSLVAAGHEKRGDGGSQPKGADIMKLHWDDELAKVAQTWADQCRIEHDSCRDDARWKVGQNIYWKFKYPNHKVNWTEAINSWYNEVSLFNPGEVESYQFNGATGHYTQIVWHDTYLIGCGRRDYGNNKLYVCNYGPTGNWIGEPMYTVGEPCSKCPEDTVCSNNLCETKNSGTKKSQSSSSSFTTEFGTSSTITDDSNSLEGPTKETPESERSPVCYGPDGKLLEEREIDEVELDEDVIKELRAIQRRISNLIKKAVKKAKSQH